MYHFHQLCDKHPDILTTDVWITIGFTYNKREEYCLIREGFGRALCLACTWKLEPTINAFCYECKVSRPFDWTTSNKSLDSFIMESQSNVENKYDSYIQWIEYYLLTNIQEMTSLRHGCTHIADLAMNGSTRVTLKKIVDEGGGIDNQSFDFHQVN